MFYYSFNFIYYCVYAIFCFYVIPLYTSITVLCCNFCKIYTYRCRLTTTNVHFKTDDNIDGIRSTQIADILVHTGRESCVIRVASFIFIVKSKIICS